MRISDGWKIVLMLVVAFVGIALVGQASAQVQLYDAQTGKYLGNLSSNTLDPNSVSNPLGQYGSPLSPDSINNPLGQYGNPLSISSPHNRLAPGNQYRVKPNRGQDINW